MKTYVELVHNEQILRGFHDQNGSDTIVIFFHGFTGSKTETGYLFRKLSDSLAKQKIDSLRFDYLGSGESDGLFSDMTLDRLLLQAKDIIDYSTNFKYKKTILLGFSMGGALTMNLLEYGDKIILLAPSIDFFSKYQNKTPGMNHLDNGNYDLNGFELNKDLIPSFDKDYMSFAKNYGKPVLIIQGTHDESVPHKNSLALSKAFEKGQFLSLENGTHLFHNRDHYFMIEGAILTFIQKEQ